MNGNIFVAQYIYILQTGPAQAQASKKALLKNLKLVIQALGFYTHNGIGKFNLLSRIHLKPINIRWIRIGSHPYEKKPMSSIVLYPVSYEYKMYNHKIKTGFNLIIVHFISAESCL